MGLANLVATDKMMAHEMRLGKLGQPSIFIPEVALQKSAKSVVGVEERLWKSLGKPVIAVYDLSGHISLRQISSFRCARRYLLAFMLILLWFFTLI